MSQPRRPATVAGRAASGPRLGPRWRKQALRLLGEAFAWNRGVAERLQHRWHFADDKWIWGEFDRRVHKQIAELPAGGVFVDLGGGRRCAYRGALIDRPDVTAIAVDISLEELGANEHLALRVAADAAAGLGLATSSVDLLASRTLLEHVADVGAVGRAVADVLRPGGTVLHFLPCRYSLFAVAARLVPIRTALAVQHLATPGSVGHVEFAVYYDAGTPAAMKRRLQAAGFRQIDVTPCWSQSDYFRPVLPLYLIVVAFDAVIRRLRLSSLATYMIVEATK